MELRDYQNRAVEWAKANDGLVIAPAGSGKTVIAAAICHHHRLPVKWLAPTRETCQQAEKALSLFGLNGNIRCPHESVDFSGGGILVVDECKHSPAAGWSRIINSHTGLIYGFDATPWCDDEERNGILRGMFRMRQYEITRADVGDSLADAEVVIFHDTDPGLGPMIDSETERMFRERRRYMRIGDDELKAMCAWQAVTDIGIVGNVARNRRAVDEASVAGVQTLVLVPRVELGVKYESAIHGAVLVHGKLAKKKRREAIEAFRRGEIRCMVATSLADEGLDLPNAEKLVMVSGGRSTQRTIQRASRVLRKAPDKGFATIVDFSDSFHQLAQRHAWKRRRVYRELGCNFIQ